SLLQIVAIASIVFFLDHISSTSSSSAATDRNRLASGLLIYGSAFVVAVAGGIHLYLRARELRKPLQAANQHDYAASRTLKQRLPALKSALASPTPAAEHA